MAVVAIVGVMGIKLSVAPKDKDSSSSGIFLQGMRGFWVVLQQVFLPHLVAGLGLFLIGSFVFYTTFLQPLRLPGLLLLVFLLIFCVLYGCFSFGYSLFASAVFSLRAVCVSLEDFIDGMLELVKNDVASRIEDMNEGLAKEQAKVLVAGSVREVMGVVGKRELKSFPRWIACLFLGGITFALRSVLIARIVQFSTATVKFSKVFAGKATLIGAVFLNLRLFSTLLLGAVYGVGVLVLFVNFLILF